MWLASYIVHVRKVHWRVGADWLYGHLLDGDLASNHLSWQWVAGTGSSKPYLFNAENVARYAPAPWHSPGSVIDQSYEALDRLARQPMRRARTEHDTPTPAELIESPLLAELPLDLGWTQPDAAAVAGREVWLVHPWNLGDLPSAPLEPGRFTHFFACEHGGGGRLCHRLSPRLALERAALAFCCQPNG